MKSSYEDHANSYVRFAKKSYSWHYIEAPAIRRHLGSIIMPKTKVLDIGCGFGRVVSYLIGLGANEANIVGIDLSYTLLRIARKEHPQANFICDDATEMLKIQKDRFNVVLSSMVFHYFDNPDLKKALQNTHQVLLSGGIFLLLVVNPKRVFEEGEIVEGWQNLSCPWGMEEEAYIRKPESYLKAIEMAGFNILAIEEPPITSQGKKDTKEYNNYSKYPARFLIKAIKN